MNDLARNSILIIQGGKGHERHFLDYQIFSKLIKQKFKLSNIDAILCNQLLNNCDFGNPGFAFKNKWFRKIRHKNTCNSCINESTNKLGSFVDNIFYLNEYTNLVNYSDINIEIEKIKNLETISCNDFINFSYKNIQIGRFVFETFQRTNKLGKIHCIVVKEQQYLLDLFSDALLLTEIAFVFLNRNKYKFILQNEFSYMLWGIFGHVALQNNIPVYHITYKSHPYLPSLFLRKTSIDLQINPFWNKFELNKFYQYKDIAESKILEISSKIPEIEQYDAKSFTDMNFSNFDSSIFKFKNNKKKNIFIFCHVSWDSSLSYGLPLFDFYEDWLDFTICIANSFKNYNWVFKIHPIEKLLKETNQCDKNIDTSDFILMNKNFNNDNMFIIKDNISNKLLLNDIDLAISSGGSVCYQLPKYGIPVINLNNGIHANFGFTIDILDKEVYKNIFQNIEIFNKLTRNQKAIANLYEILYLREVENFNTKDLIYSEDVLNKNISNIELDNWIEENISKI